MSAKKESAEKKKGRSFSLTAEEFRRLKERALDVHQFATRNAYLLALVEADDFYGLVRTIQRGKEVLRVPAEESEMEYQLRMRREDMKYDAGLYPQSDQPNPVLNDPKPDGRVSDVVPKNKRSDDPKGGAKGGTGRRS
jgi:hypothetical protein